MRHIMYPPQKDSPSTVTISAIGTTDTYLLVQDANVLPTELPFPLTLGVDKDETETVMVTEINTTNNQLTITRSDGAKAWQAQTLVARMFNASDLSAVQGNLSYLEEELDGAKSDISTLDNSIAALDVLLDNTVDRVDGLDQEVSSIQNILTSKADLVAGKVPSEQLPSYVDDVLEFASLSAFPTVGESGKIYISLDTERTYRWSGSTYAEISKSLALGETSSTAYRGDRGKTAYDHTLKKDNPHEVTKEQVGLGNVDNTSDLNKPVSTATQAATQAAIDDITIGGRNLIVQKTLNLNGFLNMSGVEEESNLRFGWFFTDYIPVKPGEQTICSGYTTMGVSPSACFYTSDKTFLMGIRNNNVNATAQLTVPENAAYLRFSAKLIDRPTIKLEKGNKATDWTPAPEDVDSKIQAHIDSKTNPHAVTKAQVGLSNVDNTSDSNKPISTAMQTALNGKASSSVATQSANGLMSSGDKSKLDGIAIGAQKNSITGVKGHAESGYRTGNVDITTANIGLGNVNNTSDMDKPISTATQAALNNKASLSVATQSANGLMSSTDKTKLNGIATGAQKNSITGVKGHAESTYRTGNVNITTSNIGLGNVDNTSDLDKPISTATQTALNGKAASSHNHSAANITSGTLPVTRGGTGAATLPSGQVLIGNGVNGILTRGITSSEASDSSSLITAGGVFAAIRKRDLTTLWSGSSMTGSNISVTMSDADWKTYTFLRVTFTIHWSITSTINVVFPTALISESSNAWRIFDDQIFNGVSTNIGIYINAAKTSDTVLTFTTDGSTATVTTIRGIR